MKRILCVIMVVSVVATACDVQATIVVPAATPTSTPVPEPGQVVLLRNPENLEKLRLAQEACAAAKNPEDPQGPMRFTFGTLKDVRCDEINEKVMDAFGLNRVWLETGNPQDVARYRVEPVALLSVPAFPAPRISAAREFWTSRTSDGRPLVADIQIVQSYAPLAAQGIDPLSAWCKDVGCAAPVIVGSEPLPPMPDTSSLQWTYGGPAAYAGEPTMAYDARINEVVESRDSMKISAWLSLQPMYRPPQDGSALGPVNNARYWVIDRLMIEDEILSKGLSECRAIPGLDYVHMSLEDYEGTCYGRYHLRHLRLIACPLQWSSIGVGGPVVQPETGRGISCSDLDLHNPAAPPGPVQPPWVPGPNFPTPEP